jgi:hypothetical protein
LRHGGQGANVEGHTVVVKEEERPAAGNVINLMEASKRNIEGTAPAKGKRPGVGKKRAKRLPTAIRDCSRVMIA